MSQAAFEVDVTIHDPAALRAFAETLDPGLEEDCGLDEVIQEALVNPRTAPLDAGYEILRKEVLPLGGDRHRLRVTAEVHDPALLVRAACADYALCWQDGDWRPDSLGEALYETLLASNASPGPDVLGFEIQDRSFEGEALAPASPTP